MAVAWLLVVGVAVVGREPGAGAATGVQDPPDWVDDLAEEGSEGPRPVSWEAPESRSLQLDDSDAADPLEAADLPEPGAWEVVLADAEEPGSPARGTAGPVEVTATSAGFAGDRLRIEVLDEVVAERVGASGFVFEVSDGGAGAGPLSRIAADEAVPVELSVDYSGFAEAFGGTYADRLRVVALPDCVLDDPMPDDCAAGGVPLPTRNDRTAEELVIEVDDLASMAAADDRSLGAASATDAADSAAPTSAGSGGALFAMTSAVSGEEGTYAATPLSVTAQWQVSPGSGEFSYTYDFDLPEPAGGTAPSLAMSYSSGAVDGMTNASNTQAGATGMGWSRFEGAFIERRYEPCVLSPVLASEDLCWLNHNATLSLGGVSGTLLPVDGTNDTQWRLHSDTGWKIERLTGANNGDGDTPDVTDDVGEHWKVTATDGTQYFFGLGRNPDTSEPTHSTALVPVFTDHPSEPCYGNVPQAGVCDQPWRWSLDRVVDPDGNVTTYFYDRGSNRYGALNGFFPSTTYHRSILLDHIDYGARAGSGAGAQATVRVQFQRQYRCTALDTSCTTPPSDDANTTGADEPANFPDVPADLICSTSTCSAHAPAFFSTSRYSALRTMVRVGTGASDWRNVTQYNLDHDFGQMSGSSRKMVLRAVQRVGLTDPGNPLGFPMPSTIFNFVWRDNRVDVDPSQGRTPMPHPRVSQVINELGGRTDVIYGQSQPCQANYRPALWTANDRDCFPQTIVDKDGRRVGVFHKYLVTQTTETATPFLTNPMTTDYTYDGTPAWAFSFGAFAQYETEWGWSGWRGYGVTRITQGNSTSRVRVFRGMHGDPLWLDQGGGVFCVCGEREANVTSSDGSSFADFPSLAGRTLEEESLGTLDGAPNATLQSTRYEYERQITLPPGSGQLRPAEWAGVSRVTETTTSPGLVQQRGSTTSYESVAGVTPLVMQAVSTLEEGSLNQTGDERCSRTTYADNGGAWMFEYPASNVTVAGDCTSTELVSASETYYDGSTTLGAAPGRGNPTRERTRLDSTTWTEATTLYDPLGRPTAVTDANGSTTTTSYAATPAHAIPTGTTVTDDLGHSQTTEWMPQYQVPLRETDANGNVTTYGYDGLGRLIAVRLPTEQPDEPGKAQSWRFAYSVDQVTGTTVVQSQQLTSQATSGSGVTYEDAWVIYDGLGREWQVQQRSPASGQVLLSGTTYDARGLVYEAFQPQSVSGTPGTLQLAALANATRTTYDELGRPVTQQWMRAGSPVRTTQTVYAADTVTVTGPEGNQVRETLDGLGRTTAVAELDGTSWVTSTYGYNLADDLLTVTDPAANQTVYTYDLAGRRLTQDDPNRGTRSYTYDPVGNLIRVQGGLGNVVHTTFDPLGRPTSRRSGSATGPLLAEWDYDDSGLGLPFREIRHTADGDWVSEVTGYDQRSRPLGTTLTVPAGIPGLSGSYTVSQTYDRADRATSVTYPAIGGLPEETVTTSFDNRGLATGLSGLAPYVRTTEYDDRGRLVGAAFGTTNPGGGVWMARSLSYNDDQQRATTQTYVAGSGVPEGIVARHELSYDNAGNLADRATVLNGQEWRECYEHDTRQRLTRAYTVDIDTTCTQGVVGTGDQPYENRFAYLPDGRLSGRTEVVDPEWDDVIVYGYTPPAGDPPQAPTSVGSNTYDWDDNGNLVQRTVGSSTESYAWDVEQNLASVSGADGTTSFVYDVNGQRLLRRTASDATLYFAGHEIHANASGSVVTPIRSYTFEGELVATRTPGGVSYMVTDDANSVEMSIQSGGQPTAARSYEPYGQVRSETGGMATEQGFVGRIEDSSTNLSYLQNRYYDTTIGLFTSADPIYDINQIRTLNPFGYAAGNPTTMTDPDGLSPTYIHGLEVQNRELLGQNRELLDHIGRLGNHIEELQSIISRQNRLINKLVTRIRALERVIVRQQSVIRRLVNRVNYLVGVVNAQRVVIGRLQAKVQEQRRIIRAQAGVIRYQGSVITGLVNHAFIPAYRGMVLASIAAGNGVPLAAFEGSSVVRARWRYGQTVGWSGTGLPIGAIDSAIDSGFARGLTMEEINGELILFGGMYREMEDDYFNTNMDYQTAALISDTYGDIVNMYDEFKRDFVINTGCFVGGAATGGGVALALGSACHGYSELG